MTKKVFKLSKFATSFHYHGYNLGLLSKILSKHCANVQQKDEEETSPLPLGPDPLFPFLSKFCLSPNKGVTQVTKQIEKIERVLYIFLLISSIPPVRRHAGRERANDNGSFGTHSCISRTSCLVVLTSMNLRSNVSWHIWVRQWPEQHS